MATGWGDNPSMQETAGWGANAPNNRQDAATQETTGWGELPPVEGTSTQGTGVWGDCAGWSATPWGQPHRWITESPINWNLEDEDEEDASMEHQVDTQVAADSSFVQQVAPDQYSKQTTEYTKAALDQLIHSPEYLRVHTRCQLCWHVWSESQYGEGCVECGGFAMQRPCAICQGKCGRIFTRDVNSVGIRSIIDSLKANKDYFFLTNRVLSECGGFAMQRPCSICQGKCGRIFTRDVNSSHTNHEAQWDGECGLPPEQQLPYLQQIFLHDGGTEEDIIDGLEDLNTG